MNDPKSKILPLLYEAADRLGGAADALKPQAPDWTIVERHAIEADRKLTRALLLIAALAQLNDSPLADESRPWGAGVIRRLR